MSYICKQCKKEFDVGYGTNIFCSRKCLGRYAASQRKISDEDKLANLAKAREHIQYVHYDWECPICKGHFTSRTLFFDHKKSLHGKGPIKIEAKCPYCEHIATTKAGLTNHIKYCKNNPNRIDGAWKGRKHTNEEKEKISNGTKKAHDEGRGHTWTHRTGEPSYAEKWLYGFLDARHIDYKKEVPFFGFFLDVVIESKGICIEIDGEQHYADGDPRFPEQVERDKRKDALLKEKGWCELRLRWSEVQANKDAAISLLDEFIENSYSEKAVEYIRALHKKAGEKKRERKEKIEKGQVDKLGRPTSFMVSNEEWEKRKNLILNSGVDINKFGWVGKIEKITGLSKHKIEDTLKHFPEVFEGKYFKRN